MQYPRSTAAPTGYYAGGTHYPMIGPSYPYLALHNVLQRNMMLSTMRAPYYRGHSSGGGGSSGLNASMEEVPRSLMRVYRQPRNGGAR